MRTMSDLEAECSHREKQNQGLRACLVRLRGEVLELKTEILRQSDCNCPLMRGYVSAEAERFVASMTKREPWAGEERSSLKDGIIKGADDWDYNNAIL